MRLILLILIVTFTSCSYNRYAKYGIDGQCLIREGFDGATNFYVLNKNKKLT